ncbi:hypothetical protein BH18ACT1_BH18ACT1_18520 [soil metagenome]
MPAATGDEGRDYPGLVTSHSWGDETAQRRLQALGGVVSPYAETSPDYVGSQAAARPGATTDRPVTYPHETFKGTVMHKQRSGTRVYDINTDGAAHYVLFPDWVEDLRHLAGSEIVEDMANGAETYLQMWARADALRVD